MNCQLWRVGISGFPAKPFGSLQSLGLVFPAAVMSRLRETLLGDVNRESIDVNRCYLLVIHKSFNQHSVRETFPSHKTHPKDQATLVVTSLAISLGCF